MKVYIDEDEWYPVYDVIISDNKGEYDIPQDKYEWIQKVCEEFGRVQSYLEEIVNATSD